MKSYSNVFLSLALILTSSLSELIISRKGKSGPWCDHLHLRYLLHLESWKIITVSNTCVSFQLGLKVAWLYVLVHIIPDIQSHQGRIIGVLWESNSEKSVSVMWAKWQWEVWAGPGPSFIYYLESSPLLHLSSASNLLKNEN